MALFRGTYEDFQKFTLKYTDFPTIMNNLAKFLRYSAVKIDSKDQKPISWFVEIMNMVGFLCYNYVFVVSAVWFVFVRCPQTGDYIAASVVFSLATCCETSILKFVFLKLQSKAITKIIDDYLECHSRVDPKSRLAALLTSNLRTIKKRGIITWIVLVMNGVVYVSLPFFRPGRHLAEDFYVLYGLEPMFESPNFEIATAFLTTAVSFGVLTIVNYRLLITMTIGYVEALMLAISEELLNLWGDATEFYKKFSESEPNVAKNISENVIKNVIIKHRLREMVKFHITGINLQRTVENKFRYIYVVEFLFAMLGIVTELLAGLNHTYLELPYSLNQVILDCFVGQRLIDASNVLEESVYGCQWENYNVENQKTVLLMLQNTQKTLTLSAGGLSVLDFVCLMTVIRGTYSAYTALHSSMD